MNTTSKTSPIITDEMRANQQIELDMKLTSLATAIARLRASHYALFEALCKAKEIIRVWHGMNIQQNDERAIWEAYQSSPEMRLINAAIAKAKRSAP